MHGRQWHEHSEARDLEPASRAGADAVPEAEGGGTKRGSGRLRGGKVVGTQGRVKRKRMTPVSKGPKKKPGAAKHISQSGHRAKGRA